MRRTVIASVLLVLGAVTSCGADTIPRKVSVEGSTDSSAASDRASAVDAPRVADADGVARPSGTVMYFREDEGFGVIRPEDGSKNLVVHWTQIMSDSRAPRVKAGDRVEYTVLDTSTGLYACAVWRTSDPWLDWWEAPYQCGSLVALSSSALRRAAEETEHPRAEDEISMSTGTVMFFKDDKGYGFIRPDAGGKDVFFHWSEIVDAGLFPSMKRGQWVEYWLVDDPDGPRACSVRVLGDRDTPEPGDPQSIGPTVDPAGRCVERPSDWSYEPPS